MGHRPGNGSTGRYMNLANVCVITEEKAEAVDQAALRHAPWFQEMPHGTNTNKTRDKTTPRITVNCGEDIAV